MISTVLLGIVKRFDKSSNKPFKLAVTWPVQSRNSEMQLKQLIWAGKRRTRQFARKPILRHLHHNIALLRYFFLCFFQCLVLLGLYCIVLNGMGYMTLICKDLWELESLKSNAVHVLPVSNARGAFRCFCHDFNTSWCDKCLGSILTVRSVVLGYLKDSNAAAHSVDTGIS